MKNVLQCMVTEEHRQGHVRGLYTFARELWFWTDSNCSNQPIIMRWFDATLAAINSNWMKELSLAWMRLGIMRGGNAEQRTYLWTNWWGLIAPPPGCGCVMSTAHTNHNDWFLMVLPFLPWLQYTDSSCVLYSNDNYFILWSNNPWMEDRFPFLKSRDKDAPYHTT